MGCDNQTIALHLSGTRQMIDTGMAFAMAISIGMVYLGEFVEPTLRVRSALPDAEDLVWGGCSSRIWEFRPGGIIRIILIRPIGVDSCVTLPLWAS